MAVLEGYTVAQFTASPSERFEALDKSIILKNAVLPSFQIRLCDGISQLF